MPAYDFRCGSCRHTFEIVRPAADTSAVLCPSCGSGAKRVFSPVGVVFKGSGFYNTDYRGKKTDADAGKQAGDGDSGGNGDGAKKDASPCPAKESGSCGGCGSD